MHKAIKLLEWFSEVSWTFYKGRTHIETASDVVRSLGLETLFRLENGERQQLASSKIRTSAEF
jgi:hypothetical protein